MQSLLYLGLFQMQNSLCPSPLEIVCARKWVSPRPEFAWLVPELLEQEPPELSGLSVVVPTGIATVVSQTDNWYLTY